MTIAEFSNTPLFSLVNTWAGKGYIVKKMGNLCFVYNPLVINTDDYTFLEYFDCADLTLISKYTPPKIPNPPYTIQTLPIFSTVNVNDGSFVTDGIAVDKSSDKVCVFLPDDTVMWIRSELITFISPPPGATMMEYPDVTDEPSKTSLLLIAVGIIFVSLIWVK